jgi:hypothetical protein
VPRRRTLPASDGGLRSADRDLPRSDRRAPARSAWNSVLVSDGPPTTTGHARCSKPIKAKPDVGSQSGKVEANLTDRQRCTSDLRLPKACPTTGSKRSPARVSSCSLSVQHPRPLSSTSPGGRAHWTLLGIRRRYLAPAERVEDFTDEGASSATKQRVPASTAPRQTSSGRDETLGFTGRLQGDLHSGTTLNVTNIITAPMCSLWARRALAAA